MKYTIIPGIEVPEEVRKLTRKEKGVMEAWLNHSKEDMVAIILNTPEGKLIGWGCYIRVRNWFFGVSNHVEISVFVSSEYRSKGYASVMVNKMLEFLRVENPKAIVRYGAPNDSDFFNNSYDKIIIKNKLSPYRYFAINF